MCTVCAWVRFRKGFQGFSPANHRKSGITEIKKGLFSEFLRSSHVVGVEPKQKMTNYS